ncbi:F-box/kelch-repeat protein At3g23880-like [Spinacia oleracea]|uniref:F-box/kelch-repeat protein At3g23880-like n=1 Tax=Spinacia oleracea TaxID=3562 RepID=A0ABM3QHA3_SPIOL|nr:F-box/kelch-repeat protein At3g23880-like [Spinacia oleracea]
MANLNKLETSDDHLKYLPPDLCQEILARLSVKTLLRFRCVCKYWCSIIDSSVFTYMHLNLYQNNPRKNNNLVLCVESHNAKQSICVRFHRINTFHRIGEKIEIHLPKRRRCLIVGICKGLLLTTFDGNRLWNIRKSLLLPCCPIRDTYVNDVAIYVNYVVGFAPSTNDYKVVAFTYNSMAVYSLRDHCWKVKNNTEFMNPKWHVPKPLLRFHDVVFVGKAAYWFEFGPRYYYKGSYTHQQNRIVSFDFDVEEINLLKLPDHVVWNGIIGMCLCSIEDSLALFLLCLTKGFVYGYSKKIVEAVTRRGGYGCLRA